MPHMLPPGAPRLDARARAVYPLGIDARFSRDAISLGLLKPRLLDLVRPMEEVEL